MSRIGESFLHTSERKINGYREGLGNGEATHHSAESGRSVDIASAVECGRKLLVEVGEVFTAHRIVAVNADLILAEADTGKSGSLSTEIGKLLKHVSDIRLIIARVVRNIEHK